MPGERIDDRDRYSAPAFEALIASCRSRSEVKSRSRRSAQDIAVRARKTWGCGVVTSPAMGQCLARQPRSGVQVESSHLTAQLSSSGEIRIIGDPDFAAQTIDPIVGEEPQVRE